MSLRSSATYTSPGKIQSGMMIDFSYTKKDSTAGRYEVIVIDPAKKSGDNLYLHGLLIDDLSDMDLVRVSTEIGQVFNYDPDGDRKAPLTYLQSDVAYERYKASPFLSKRIYRTFLLESIRSPRQIVIGELT